MYSGTYLFGSVPPGVNDRNSLRTFLPKTAGCVDNDSLV